MYIKTIKNALLIRLRYMALYKCVLID